jgi:hypothetical protein
MDAELAHRLLRLRTRLGMGRAGFAVPRQVHGNRVVESYGASAAEWEEVEGDAVVARRAANVPAPAIRFADCVPILMADSTGRAVAAVHAGWRGTVCGVASAAVERLVEQGAKAADLLAAIGPAIGACCFEVEPEVARRLRGEVAPPAGPQRWTMRPKVDLAAINRDQLICSGLDPAHISTAPWCTRCHERLFHSHRRDGDAAGRHLACIGWVEDRPPAGAPA